MSPAVSSTTATTTTTTTAATTPTTTTTATSYADKDERERKQSSQQQSSSSSSQSWSQWWLIQLLGKLLDPTLLRPSSTTVTDLIDKILTSKPRLLAIANLLLAGTYLLHSAVANFFLGTTRNSTSRAGRHGRTTTNTTTPWGTTTTATTTTTTTGTGMTMGTGGASTSTAARDQRLGGFLVFKLLLISAVVAPDTLDLLILLSWYTLLSFLRSLAFLCASTTQHTSQSGQAPRPGVLQLLSVVLVCNLLAAAVCVGLFHGAGMGMVLLLTCDNALLLVDVTMHMLQYLAQVWETQHGERVSVLEAQQIRWHQRWREMPQREEEEAAAAAAAAGELERFGRMTMDSNEEEDDNEEEEEEEETAREREDDNGGHPDDEPEEGNHHNEYSNSQGHDASDRNNQSTTPRHAIPAHAEDDLDHIDTRELDRRMEILEQQHMGRLSMLDTAVFGLQLLTHALTVCHFLHIWSLHGVQFTLIDGVLALHLHSALTSASKKIAERRNLHRIARDLDGMFENASELDLRKAAASGDVCCICLGGMSTGNVKKVGCGHMYHTSCLREVVERARSMEAARCPLCRASVTDGRQPATGSNRPNNNTNIRVGQPPQQQAAPLVMDGAVALNPNNVNARNDLAAANINNNNNNNLGAGQQRERALFRFSSEEVFPSWLPLPAFSFEVVRRPSAAQEAAENEARNNNTQQMPQDLNATPAAQQGHEQPSFWRRLLVLAGAISMSPEEEAAALDQLVDMFPQYDRADLLRELRDRGSLGAVAESVLAGSFTGIPRGIAGVGAAVDLVDGLPGEDASE